MELFVAIMAGSVATLVTLGYEFGAIWKIYYGELPEKLKDVVSVPKAMAITLIALSALSVILGIWPALITNPIEVYIEHIFH
jgi:NADH:ubiquinone oxidoreductase subunit 4 (subunit M)